LDIKKSLQKGGFFIPLFYLREGLGESLSPLLFKEGARGWLIFLVIPTSFLLNTFILLSQVCPLSFLEKESGRKEKSLTVKNPHNFVKFTSLKF